MSGLISIISTKDPKKVKKSQFSNKGISMPVIIQTLDG
jgi:hypothetical protein